MPYFLGSVVVASNDDVEAVLDGQQRLVTISLLLSSIRHLLIEQKYNKANKEIDDLLTQESKGRRRDEEDQIKIRLQREDTQTYTSLIEDPTLYKTYAPKKNLLARAVQKILTDVTGKYLKIALEKGVSKKDALLLMLDKVAYYATFVKIVSPTESDAFRLFETLNDRGLALNAADLVKNKLLAQCDDSKHLDEAIGHWKSIVELVGEDELVNFLRYYWIAFHSSVRKRDLYKVFEEHLKKLNPRQAADFAKSLKYAARDYAGIINPEDSKTRWDEEVNGVLKRLLIYKARTCRPVLLICASKKPDCMLVVAKACESITVRHSIVSDLSSNELEKSYANLARKIKDGNQNIVEAVKQELSKHALTDEEFERNFSSIQTDRVTDTWRQVLIQLNEGRSTGETTVKGARSVHVEHILPRNPTNRTLKEASLDKVSANALSGMIGNLTLLSGSKNREGSNGPFSIKKDILASSEIALNKEIAEKERWGEEEIFERNKRLGQLATVVWPWPIL